jgi:phage host-nuclease inhibitor protein Gam
MTKKTKAATTIRTREELDTVLGEYAATAIARGQLSLAMDERLNLVRKDYEERLAELDDSLQSLFEDMEAWAALNPAAFADKRSIDLVHGTLGFRTGNPALKTIKGCKWEHVLDMLKCNKLAKYVRTVEEPNKDALLADREAIGAEKLAALGMRVEQAERFYADPKLETV